MLPGQYLPLDSNVDTNFILVGEMPSDFYLKNPSQRHYGNYNNPKSASDNRLKDYISKYLGRAYVTDMVKTEGPSGHDFIREWYGDHVHKRLLGEELDRIKPRKIGAFGRKVEKLLKNEFPQYEIVYLIHPSATRYKKNQNRWDDQFKNLLN
jgi:hypothetical protein